MASFDWRAAPNAFVERYAQPQLDDVQGIGLWLEFVYWISEQIEEPADIELEEGIIGQRTERFEALLNAFAGLPPPKQPRVFISHRQVDVGPAERIAWLASQRAGIDYWLDVHDPALGRLNVSPRSSRYPWLVASIVEMALLNCSHVIAAHTPNSLGSKWIPYEFGRVKDRALRSKRAAGWFHSSVYPVACGEFVLLADILRSDTKVEAWLRGHSPNAQARPFLRPLPPPLP
jgi:hypothetical protein